MEKNLLKNYKYILGICLLLTGILLFALFSSPVRFLGIVLITMAYIYFAIILYSKFGETDDEHFRSRARDQILKRQYRK